MKKILLLGGSSQQIIAIKKSKSLGYFTILCDYLPDNPGQNYADVFYKISTTDKEAILEIAKKEKINGILAYASDPAAPTAAYVAEKLNLYTNPFASVDTLCNKDKFRVFLSNNGFNTPKSVAISSLDEKLCLEKFSYPLIIKPVDSSGSKGVTVVRGEKEVLDALKFAFSFSRNSKVIIEEFVEKKHQYLIGGDIFVINGKVELWGLLNCHRDSSVNKLVPVGKSNPIALNEEDIINVKNCLQNMVNLLNINQGAMNVELVIDKNNKVWPIDIGPRNGGNMIPDLLEMIYGVDIVEMTIKSAMGEIIHCEPDLQKKCFATHNLHSSRNGIFKEVFFDELIKKHIIKEHIYKKEGDYIEFFDNASKALGIVFFKFDNEIQMFNILNNINEHIKIIIKED